MNIESGQIDDQVKKRSIDKTRIAIKDKKRRFFEYCYPIYAAHIYALNISMYHVTTNDVIASVYI